MLRDEMSAGVQIGSMDTIQNSRRCGLWLFRDAHSAAARKKLCQPAADRQQAAKPLTPSSERQRLTRTPPHFLDGSECDVLQVLILESRRFLKRFPLRCLRRFHSAVLRAQSGRMRRGGAEWVGASCDEHSHRRHRRHRSAGWQIIWSSVVTVFSPASTLVRFSSTRIPFSSFFRYPARGEAPGWSEKGRGEERIRARFSERRQI